jgi:hypothetical protein
MKKNKDNFFDHIDFWLKILLKHFDHHKIQARIFFTGISLSIIIWSLVISIYTGQGIYDWILLSFKCK